MDPVAFNVMQAKMKVEAADIKSKNMSSAFYQQEIKVSGKKVLGYGELVSMMSGQTIGSQRMGYKLEFDYRNGKLFVKSFEKNQYARYRDCWLRRTVKAISANNDAVNPVWSMIYERYSIVA